MAQSLSSFRALFAILTRRDAPVGQLLTAFDLTQYVCERLQPDEKDAQEWLRCLIDLLSDASVPSLRREDISASAVVFVAFTPGREVFRWARMRMLKLKVDLSSELPSLEGAAGFRSILPSQMSTQEVWHELLAIRTYPEQVRAYLSALERRTPSDGYPDLPSAARAEWRVLQAAITSSGPQRRIVVTSRADGACPDCNTVLPTSERHKLQSTGIATAVNCCGRVVIVSEE